MPLGHTSLLGAFTIIQIWIRGPHASPWRANGEAHAFENFTRIDRWMDRRKNFQTSVTIRTLQNVEFKDTFRQLGPQIIPAVF